LGGQRATVQVFGRCSKMRKGEAEAALSAILQPINSGPAQGPRPLYTLEQFVERKYLPFCRQSWKISTADTSEQIVKTHLVPELGKDLPLQSNARHCRIFSTERRAGCPTAR
jgi:hypothetical protein